MKTTAEMKIEVSNARISKAMVMPDGTCKIEFEVENNGSCILIEASKLSLNDEFMKHIPKTEGERKFKAKLTRVIKEGIDDFYRPVMDPSLDINGQIYYEVGKLPAVGKSYNWWKKAVKDSKWCIGTESQYVAFLGVLIKMLIEKKWACWEAWDAVCNNSINLGNYFNSNNSKGLFEHTGSKEICGFYDLSNTHKILAIDKETEGYVLASGSWQSKSLYQPLASLGFYNNNSYCHLYSVAWLVLKA